MHPLTFPVWPAGRYYYIACGREKWFRILGLTYVIILLLFVVLRGKVYYHAPIYPMLFASGAGAIQHLIEQSRNRWLKPATISAFVVGGMVTAPSALPLLPIESFIRYADLLGVRAGIKTERHEIGSLPQHYTDMFGWENMMATVAKVYADIPPEEQAQCVIFTQNFGEAAAIDFFGRAYQLPQAISGHQNYYIWGPKGHSGEITIIIVGKSEDHRKVFSHVEQVAVITNEYAMAYENNLPVYVCKGIKTPLDSIWPQVKHYN